ncbi:EthD family reductase [Lichenihabitans sp. Uapishka_5]|uniref:EthD family reductase n=1 Tax=Lichenihabitans sp. Uapishka_5 TaxID=3037302 RepID=UPI0029E7FCA9|nr:EthD family reductase [Lichenihabitans sp. Uapishka_5]MDX7953537.1 EthD family reductase [Lichenihabitans sp. Uapishka_5]
MAASIIVLYENTAGATFDLDYYLTKHMPLVSERFARFGLKGWRVTRSAGTLDGSDPKFSIAAILDFETPDQFKQAVAAEGAAVFGDVPNFSNTDPVVMISEVVGAA